MHDPKGKSRIALTGVRASADVSPCGRWRRSLVRDWTPPGQAPRAILWVGMNPSTADAQVDDPTCAREQGFSRAWGFTRYLKGNALDWRATFPGDIPLDPALACTPEGHRALERMAQEAEIIVAGWGKLPPKLAHLSRGAADVLLASGKPIFCLGRNGDGSPKHPLYLKKTTPLIPFTP